MESTIQNGHETQKKARKRTNQANERLNAMNKQKFLSHIEKKKKCALNVNSCIDQTKHSRARESKRKKKMADFFLFLLSVDGTLIQFAQLFFIRFVHFVHFVFLFFPSFLFVACVFFFRVYFLFFIFRWIHFSFFFQFVFLILISQCCRNSSPFNELLVYVS